MEDVIRQLMSDIGSIKLSLETIAQLQTSNNSIIITIIGIIGTMIGSVVGAVVGAVVSAKQSKQQEKDRMIAMLKAEYYKDYEDIFTEFKGELLKLKKDIYTMGRLFCEEDKVIKGYLDGIHTAKDVVDNRSSNFIENVFKSSKKSLDSITLLNQYIESRSECIKYDYSEIFNTLKKIRDKLDEMDTYSLICNEWKDKPGIDKYVERYKNVSSEIISKKVDLEEMESSIKNIHKKIKNDFIGEYFK